MNRFLVATLVLSGLVFAPVNATGASSVERLLDLLIKKGVITKEESEALRQEVQEDKAQKAEDRTEKGVQEKLGSKAKEWTDKIEVGYKDGAYIKTKDDRFLLKLGAAVQPFFDYQALDGRDDSTTFRLRRARLYASGNAFYPWLQYATQLTLEGGSVALRDYTLAVTAWKEVQPTVGQFKVPFDREFLTSGLSLQLIERSIASDEFSLQRDIGVQLAGQLAHDQLEYRVGIFNGSGANRSNVDDEYIYLGRLVFTPFGPLPYSQAALDDPATPRLALGVAGAYLPGLQPGERQTLAGRLGNTNVVPVESDVVQVTTDVAFRYRGFSMEGAYHFRHIDPKAQTTFGNVDAHGLFIQAGYFLIPKHFEVAARYAFVDPDNPNSVGRNNQHEATVGASYYLFGHRLKGQLNYTFRATETLTKDLDDHLVRTTLIFQF